MAFDAKAATPDTSFPANGFLLGADSQSASDPSLYSHTAYRDYIYSLASTWTANGAVSAPAKTGVGTWYTGGTATTTKPYWLIEPTGTTSTGWSTNGTAFGINASTGYTGNLIDAQLNGAARFSVTAAGITRSVQYNLGTSGSKIAAWGADDLAFYNSSGTSVFAMSNSGASATSGLWLGSGYTLGWGNNSNGGGGTFDLALWRDAANTLALRNSTNAQTFNTYGTYTDGSNYRRVTLTMTTAGVASLSASGAGTGSSGNVLHISSLPTSNPGPGILWNNAGTPAIGT